MDTKKTYKTKKHKEKDMEFSERLKKTRNENIKITQVRLAELLDVEQATISSWESEGVVPDHKMIEKICNIPERKLRPSWLFYDEQPQYVDQLRRGELISEKPVEFVYEGPERREGDRRANDIKKHIISIIGSFDGNNASWNHLIKVRNFLEMELLKYLNFKHNKKA